MKIRKQFDNICFGVVDPRNINMVIKNVCSTCEGDRFNAKIIQIDCEYSDRVLKTECLHCGKEENYKYKENIFIKTNGEQM